MKNSEKFRVTRFTGLGSKVDFRITGLVFRIVIRTYALIRAHTVKLNY